MRITNFHKPTLFAIGLACLGLLLFAARPAFAVTPTTINFQGKVVNNSTGNVGINVADSSYTVVFRLYNTASPTIGGTCTTGGCLWEETDSVTTVNGVFQVELGNASGCSFFTPASCNNSAAIDFTSNSLYLTMKFNGDSAGFMTPLIHFTGVPYAYNAGLLGGIGASGFIQNTTTAQSANIAIQSSASTNIGEVIKGATSQTADFFQVQDSSGNILDRLDAGGNFDSSGYLTNPSGGLGAFGNALNYSEGFDNTFAWLRTNVTAPTADTIVDPTGATTAEALADSASGGKIYETSAIVPSNTSYTFSVWLKGSGSQNVDLRIDGSTTGTGTVKTVTATTTWQRFFVTQNVNGFTGFVQPTIFPGGTGGTATIDAWGAQLVQGTAMGVYTRTGNGIVQAVNRGLVTNGIAYIDPQDSTTAFQVATGHQSPVFTVDTQNQKILLGQNSQYSGTVVFYNSAGNNTVTLAAQGVDPTSSVSIFLPTAGGTGVQCLQSTSGSTSTSTTLQFGSCAGGGTLATTYTAGSGTGDQTILLTSGDGGAIKVQDASGGLGGNLFSVQKFAGTVNYLGVSATGINIQSNATGSAVNALAFDTSTTTPHLKIYDSGGSANYADIYYTGTTAVYGASTGTAVLGGGTGPVSISAGTGSGFSITGDANSTISTTTGNITVTNGNTQSTFASSGTSVKSTAVGGSTTAFQVQNSSGTAVLGIDTTNFNIFLGNTSNSNTIKIASGTTSSSYTIILPTAGASATNYCLVMSNTGTGATSWVACGASASTRLISLVPEFPGAVMTPDGANNSGTMTSDFCGNDGAGSFADLNTGVCNTSGDFHNYYNWTSNGANDYDVFVRWRVPSDFSSFSTVQFNSKKSATGDDVKLTLYTNSGAACGTGTSMTNTASAWQTTTYTISGCAPSAGDMLIFDIHMAVAANGNTCQMGEIPITYNRN